MKEKWMRVVLFALVLGAILCFAICSLGSNGSPPKAGQTLSTAQKIKRQQEVEKQLAEPRPKTEIEEENGSISRVPNRIPEQKE